MPRKALAAGANWLVTLGRPIYAAPDPWTAERTLESL